MRAAHAPSRATPTAVRTRRSISIGTTAVYRDGVAPSRGRGSKPRAHSGSAPPRTWSPLHGTRSGRTIDPLEVPDGRREAAFVVAAAATSLEPRPRGVSGRAAGAGPRRRSVAPRRVRRPRRRRHRSVTMQYIFRMKDLASFVILLLETYNEPVDLVARVTMVASRVEFFRKFLPTSSLSRRSHMRKRRNFRVDGAFLP